MAIERLNLVRFLMHLTDSVESQLHEQDEAPKFKRVGKTS